MTRSQKIQSAFVEHRSDKADHGYAHFYAEHLPEEPASILEIGVKRGASMRAWRELFPSAQLTGMDLFIEFREPSIAGIRWIKGNQLNHELLYDIRYNLKPQVIIEDASHDCIKHWVTFMSLIPACEFYFLEDLHTCKDEFFREGLTFDQTILGAMLSEKFPFNYTLSADQKIAVIRNIKR